MNLKLSIGLLALIGSVTAAKADTAVTLYAYYNSSTDDHFYTTDYSELGSGANGYSEVTADEFPVWSIGASYAIEAPTTWYTLYRYYNSGNGLHYYTTDYSELGSGALGYTYEEEQCLTVESDGYPDWAIFAQVIYRYLNSTTGGHRFYSAAQSGDAPPYTGWSEETTVGYDY